MLHLRVRPGSRSAALHESGPVARRDPGVREGQTPNLLAGAMSDQARPLISPTEHYVVIAPYPYEMDHPRLHRNGWVRTTKCHVRAVDAIREFVEAVRPDVVGADDEAIRGVWPAVHRGGRVELASTHELF